MSFPELVDKSIGVFDWEAAGFLDVVDKTYCMSLVDFHTRAVVRMVSENPGELEDALAKLDSYDILVGQNIIGYDLPMLLKLYGWKPRERVIILDTLWMSRMYNPDLEGGHSLGAWGERLGNEKKEYYPISDPQQTCYDPTVGITDKKVDKGWDTAHYTDNMGDYCDQDVLVNLDLFNKLLSLLENFSFRSIICEMDTAKIIQRQMETGFVFDYQAAELLHAKFIDRIGELEDEVRETFYPVPKIVREIQPKVKADGTVSSVGLKKLDGWEKLIVTPEYTEGDTGKVYHSGSFTLIEYPEFSLGSRQQIAERLTRLGFTLTKFTDKGNPIIDDSTLDDAVAAGITEATPLAEYFMISKRESMVKSWIEKAVWHEDQEVYRIHGFVNSMGTVTHRMTHNSPNVSQVPAGYSPYGTECRSLFTVRQGYKLVGCDADGLELRMLSHYMKDPEYREAILTGVKDEGTDIHTLNMKAAGLESRDQAKTMIYATLYGAGAAKVGAIIGGGLKEGKALLAKFYTATPAMATLTAKVKATVEKRPWLMGIDGRVLRVRSAHSALNMLLQNAGAVLMKRWAIEVTKQADALALDWNPVATVHDELQSEVLEKDVQEFSRICEEAFTTVSEDMGLYCPCAGTADVGDNWSETH